LKIEFLNYNGVDIRADL